MTIPALLQHIWVFVVDLFLIVMAMSVIASYRETKDLFDSKAAGGFALTVALSIPLFFMR